MTCPLTFTQFLPEQLCITTQNGSNSSLQDSYLNKIPIFLSVPNQGQDRDGICRSWGQHHYETFDGIYFYFPGTCSYILAQDCHSATPQYTVWVRAYTLNLPTAVFNLLVYWVVFSSSFCPYNKLFQTKRFPQPSIQKSSRNNHPGPFALV